VEITYRISEAEDARAWKLRIKGASRSGTMKTVGVWLFIVLRLGPTRLRKMYRKDPLMQGEFTVDLTPASISVQNTAGLSSQFGWNLFEYWRDGKDLMVLVYYSSAYFIINLAGLSEAQRAELRGMIGAALPKK
jgi:hypothetical protein